MVFLVVVVVVVVVVGIVVAVVLLVVVLVVVVGVVGPSTSRCDWGLGVVYTRLSDSLCPKTKPANILRWSGPFTEQMSATLPQWRVTEVESWADGKAYLHHPPYFSAFQNVKR